MSFAPIKHKGTPFPGLVEAPMKYSPEMSRNIVQNGADSWKILYQQHYPNIPPLCARHHRLEHVDSLIGASKVYKMDDGLLSQQLSLEVRLMCGNCKKILFTECNKCLETIYI